MIRSTTRRSGRSRHLTRGQTKWQRSLERLEDRVYLSVEPNWAVSAGGPDRDYAEAIVTDAAGNSYAGLRVRNSDTTYDLVIQKYDALGQLERSQTLVQGGVDGRALGIRLALDDGGNLYAAGTFDGTIELTDGSSNVGLVSRGEDDIFLAKYAADGQLLWSEHFGGLADDRVGDLALVSSGSQVSVFVTGTFHDTVTFDASPIELTSTVGAETGGFLMKVNDGQAPDVQWVQQIQDAGSVQPNDLLVTDAGDVFIAGEFSGLKPVIGGQALSTGRYFDAFIMKCHDEGIGATATWVHQIAENTHNGTSSARALVQSDDGTLYVAGHFRGIDTDFGLTELTPLSLYENYNFTDGFLVRIDEVSPGEGAETTWVKQLGSAGRLTVSDLELSYDAQTLAPNLYILGDFSISADFDPSDSAVVEKVVYGEKYSADLFLLQLDAAGDYINVWHAGGDASESAADLAIGSSGEINVFGRSTSPLVQTMAGTVALPNDETIINAGDTVLIHVNPLAPQLAITPSASLLQEATVAFQAVAPDRQSDGTVVNLSESVVWQLDGNGVGDPLGSSGITVPPLGIGRHELTATVTDNDGITAAFHYLFDLAPNAPTDLNIAIVSAGPSDVELVFTWSDNAVQEDGFYIESTVYEGLLEPAYGWTLEAEVGPDATTASLIIPSTTEATRYRVRAFAADPDGRIIESPPSEDLKVQPKATGKDKPKKDPRSTTSSLIAGAIESESTSIAPNITASPAPGERKESNVNVPVTPILEPIAAPTTRSEPVGAAPSTSESSLAADEVFSTFEEDLVSTRDDPLFDFATE